MQGLYVEGNTRSQGASSFRVLPLGHIQMFGLVMCAHLAFRFQLLKCWPRNPTAKPWTAGPLGSSHTSCEYLLGFQSQSWDFMQHALPSCSYPLRLVQESSSLTLVTQDHMNPGHLPVT